MELWQEKLAFDAEKAANPCHVCGRYGHYPVECPLLGSLKPAAKQERAPSFYVFIFGLVLGLVVGMCLMRGFA